ncbi:hypothetical protein [Dinoroseobacter sp. S76]|uniref:hypothetical protein n=1 Tax=Dinoroseobacter sp. S76 TaxID=3415124 RepID=UPI003C7BDDCD
MTIARSDAPFGMPLAARLVLSVAHLSQPVSKSGPHSYRTPNRAATGLSGRVLGTELSDTQLFLRAPTPATHDRGSDPRAPRQRSMTQVEMHEGDMVL